MNEVTPKISPLLSVWRDRWFYRGIMLIPALGAVGFLLMFLTEPPPQVSFILQIAFAIILLLAAFVVRKRNKRFGLGMMMGWAVFVLFPVSWVMLLGFTGNLM